MEDINFGNRHKYGVELLAPAGNPEAFYGAVHGGADAVYLAGNRFGARAYAENFTTDALLECIRCGHLMGRKLYLTVNTLLKECELKELYDYLSPFYEAGMDAVIVQDLGVLRFIREQFPGWKLHVSTQMTLCSGYGAALLKEMGACRIVPARELGLRELVLMKRQADVELETFIHGAMCYCYSGQCLFSSMLGGRSGNRGRCAQPCRLNYTIGGMTDDNIGSTVGNKTGGNAAGAKYEDCYPLSLKDMCTIDDIPLLIEAGIDSFKIEGRMKKPEYAAGVTAVYRRYIDKYYELRERMGPEKAAEAYRVEKEDREILSSLYIRSEVQNGYYFRHNGREMITMKSPSYSRTDEKLLAGIREKYIDDILKLPVSVEAVFSTGQPAKVTLRHRIPQKPDIIVSVTGNPVERAQKQPVTEENIKKQLNKLGGSVFYAEEIKVSADENIFYSLQQINELRRTAAAKLEAEILSVRGYAEAVNLSQKSGRFSCQENSLPLSPQQPGWAVSIHTIPQLEAVTKWICRNRPKTAIRIYVDGDLIVQDWPAVSALCGTLLSACPSELCPSDISSEICLSGSGLSGDCSSDFRSSDLRPLTSCAIYAALPYILRAADEEYLKELYEKTTGSGIFQGFLVRSMDGAGFLRQMRRGRKTEMSCRTDAGVYVWNQSAMQEIGSLAEGFCLPYELKASEQRNLLGKTPCEKIVYGRIPMMITANCLYRTMGRCRQGRMESARYHAILKDRYHAILKDRYRRDFPVDVNCRHCMNIIYNSVPLSLYSELAKWRESADLRMDFTIESPEEAERLLDAFICGKPLFQKENTITTGHERRGVE